METPEVLLLALHLGATAAMVGLIWFVQVVHYPLFASVPAGDFVAYEALHTRRTAYVVGPLMALEGVTALALLAAPPDGLGRAWPLAGLVVLAVVHASTVWLQVPLHRALSAAHDPAAIRRLVATNAVRTAGWSLRGVLAVVMIVVAAG